jgi:hypothetical protein
MYEKQPCPICVTRGQVPKKVERLLIIIIIIIIIIMV